MFKRGWVVVMVVLLVSCSEDHEQPMDNPTQIDKYFQLKDFVENQIPLLDGATVRKSLLIKGQTEEIELRMDAEAWRRELNIFVQADINKASLATAYETIMEDGLTVHRLKPGEKSAIQEIIINHEGENVRQISFKAYQDEFFYTTTSEGELMVDASGKIQSYQVEGVQKVWFLSPNEMLVKGEVQ